MQQVARKEALDMQTVVNIFLRFVATTRLGCVHIQSWFHTTTCSSAFKTQNTVRYWYSGFEASCTSKSNVKLLSYFHVQGIYRTSPCN